MKLTKYILDLGRVVAYFPGLKRVTNSTTASILLCQLLYWCDKTKDGWIYKTNYEIEDETGLTYYEQQTARKVLGDLGILEEEFKRLDRTMRYRVNQDVLNDLWENATGKKSKEVPKATPNEAQGSSASTSPAPAPLNIINDSSIQPPLEEKEEAVAPVRPKPQKRGDMLDGMLHYASSPGERKVQEMKLIQEKVEKKFHIYATNAKWQKFIEFAWIRQTKHNEPVEKFILWALNNGWDPRFWTPEKCQTMYPQAFVNEHEDSEEFVKPLPKVQPETYAPMPDDLKVKNQRLY